MPTSYLTTRGDKNWALVVVNITKGSSFRKLFRKGVADVLLFVDEKGNVRFSEIRKFCLDKHIVQSRGTVTIIMRNLTDMKLVKRKVIATRPIQTSYETTTLGKQIADHLKGLKRLLGS